MKRIAVLQTAFIGDVVLTTPLLRELRRARPDCHLTVVATPAGATLLRDAEGIDEILSFDKRGAGKGAGGLARMAMELRRRRIDVAVAAQRSARTGAIALLGGAGTRVGFAGAAGSWAYNRRVRWSSERHAVHRYLDLAGPLGGDPSTADPFPRIRVSPEATGLVERLLASEGIGPDDAVIALAPGSVWPTKRWVTEGYGQVARWAAARGYRTVLTGSAEEAPLCREVSDLAGGDVPVLAGRTSLPLLAALLARSRALVGNDSGPGHIAAAVDTPVVAVFGPTVSSAGYTPFGRSVRIVEHRDLDCRPCHRHGPVTCPLGHFRCMREIDASAVINELSRLTLDPPAED